MSKWMRIQSIQELNDALERSASQPLLLFKHSTRCPISAGAHMEAEAYLNGTPREDVTYGLIYVIENRDVSNEAAERLGVKHESPQAILIKDGQAAWHTSHSKITKSTLEEILR
ncbi:MULTISPECIES: bacillithiol system redox-active protein YtxJ [Paenibacillus]|uniref:Bacillithiol system protein YtxJ n=1 Tax=Paenibacillus barengoltzii G22 TaxID=1235795 RepID=R9LGW1_9BACL|nr:MULTISPECIES: bacillithiol system redox-active protein YtxJ [Paenibacillus]EOS57970.1 bacillithiol system protein YtxJ [Paenibacillus barengoltzii G22]MDU0332588.1 bacillithiol system redox-active protein YtxJ [Paenibacillus sp. 3LSP]